MSQVWSLADHSFSFGGLSPGKGDFDRDDTISVAAISKSRSISEGLDGATINLLNPNPPCTVTLKLRATSPFNDVLSAALQLGLKAGGGTGVSAPLFVKDGLGTSLFVDPAASVEGFPDESKGAEEGTISWVFLCPGPERWVGGH